ncbi:MAG: enoyl-CoA hydratase [Acidimicrobiales bacterium]|nr:enoyl-CoA hydratase [Acidimicrobiales bacterium]
MTEYDRIRVEAPAPGVTRVVLARPEAANAQDRRMLYELNDALDTASRDAATKVIVIAADGVHFSSGHDLRDRAKLDEFDTVLQFGEFELPGQEGYMAQEQEIYLGFCWRWRNIPKPTIASVQGKVIAGGLMLVWPFDIVIASEDARFSDPVVAFGANGVEYFAHPYEVGARKAKQMLFTGEAITAEEAYRLGMVNEVVPREQLEEATLAMATKIAAQPSMGLKLAKASVNQAMDNMGMYSTLQAAFGLHHLSHSHNGQRFGMLVDPEGADRIKSQARAQK